MGLLSGHRVSAPRLLRGAFSALGIFVGLPIYKLFGVTLGKAVISTALVVMDYSPVIGGLVGLGLLAIARRWLLSEPSRTISLARRIREVVVGAACLVAGYIVLSILYIGALAISLGVPVPRGTAGPIPPATRPATAT